jgi:hypothetical protein
MNSRRAGRLDKVSAAGTSKGFRFLLLVNDRQTTPASQTQSFDLLGWGVEAKGDGRKLPP